MGAVKNRGENPRPARRLPGYIGLTLAQAMMLVPEGEIVSIGAACVFFFVGTREEWETDHLAFPYLRMIGPQRKVVRAYEKVNRKKDGIVFIVRGNEQGCFWTRNEYIRYRENQARAGKSVVRRGYRKRIGRMPTANIGGIGAMKEKRR